MIARALQVFAMLMMFDAPLHAGTPAQTAQMCWGIGLHDRTVYHASIENREDRGDSFLELLRISGIELATHECVTLRLAAFAAYKQRMIENWRRAELEVIDTNFLSDLDY
jgi:hypothetical protein